MEKKELETLLQEDASRFEQDTYAAENTAYSPPDMANILQESTMPIVPCGEAVSSDHPADRAEQIENLPLNEQVCFLRNLPSGEAAETMAEMDEQDAVDVLENLDADDAARILAEMDPDDAVDLLEEVDEDHRDVLLRNLNPEDALELRALLTFDPDTAAGVMNTEVTLVDQDLTVDAAINLIRQEMEEKETPYYVYVVDAADKLVGVLSLRDLMVLRPGSRIRDAIPPKQEVISAVFDADKAEVARLIGHYNFLSLPIVDREGHMMGFVTHDDIIDIIQDEASSDMLGMVGAGQDETVDTPWIDSIKMRLPWLIVNMLNSCFAAGIVYLFEGSIAQMALLAVLMPIVANQSGNTGQQALAVMIRQLAMEKFESKKAWFAVLREAKIGFISSLILATLAFFVVFILSDSPVLAAVMGAALIADMTLGAIAGGSIPLILRSLGRDPAQASSIFLTALTDSGGFFIFLGLATLFVL